MWRWARVVCVVCAVCAACAARELDPAACAARFDVQRDKIIRTEESRAMGARYLSELDVGSRLECRRLCCETDSCDVFVYDEKSVGSCYLFNCGPPEDFRCKFAPHTNFSVGVLALSRRLAELQDQERLAALAVPPPATTTTTTPPPPPPPTVTAAMVKPPARPSRCSRYQFECRVGGECIAVYNACDGVPQCADGSDEGPELGCPAPPPAPTTTRPPPPPPQPVLPAAAEPESVYQESRAVEGEWPHRLVQAQPRRRPLENEPVEEAPHIFSHKGGLVQAPQYGAFEPPAAWPRGWPPAPPAPAPHSHRQHLTPGAAGDSAWAEWARGWPVPGAESELELPSPRVDPEVQPYLMGGKTMPELPVPYSSQQHTLRDSPKKGLGLQAAPPPAPAPAPAAPDTPAVVSQPRPVEVSAAAPVEPAHTASEAHAAHEAHEAHTAHETPVAHSAHAAHAAVRAEEGDGDGLSEHPPAAVLLLVLGVSMTGLAGALAGCRARAARRRLRRGKASFAHDADYLVNGMYL